MTAEIYLFTLLIASCWISSSWGYAFLPRTIFSRSSKIRLSERVADADDWLRLSSNSLQKITGKSLLETMDLKTFQEVHDDERYAVLSHDSKEDPVFCYANRATFLQFQWDDDEFYQLPSRYSAPEGSVRTNRNADVKDAVDGDLKQIPVAIRQARNGDLFELNDVVLWNVYDDSGKRVGQTAIYDRRLAKAYNGQTERPVGTDTDNASCEGP